MLAYNQPYNKKEANNQNEAADEDIDMAYHDG